MKLPVLAIDLGGTKILTSLVLDRRVMARDYSATNASRGPRGVVKRICEAIDRVLGKAGINLSGIQCVSIAAAGAIDTKNGVVTLSPNLPGWRNIPLAEMVREQYSTSVFLINDANAAAVGEHRYGAGKGARDLIYLTVSTGVGGGIIINNKMYEGVSGAAGEIGHMSIDINGPKCNCGNTGCLEMLASGTALAKEAINRIKKGQKSILLEMVKGKIEKITAREIGEAAEKGDKLALRAIGQTATFLGIGLTNLINIFNPEIIVIGGGVAKLGDLLFEPACKVVKERAFPLQAGAVKIVAAELGDDSGIIGAAAWARANMK